MAESTSSRKSLKTTEEVSVLRRAYYAKPQRETGKKIAWHSQGFPVEILHAMDVVPVDLENYASVISSKRLGSTYCAAGEAAGFSPDVCGYARIFMGYLLGKDLPEPPYGGLSKPDVLMVNSYMCDSRLGWFFALSQHLKVPMFVLDEPHQPDGGCDLIQNIVYTESSLRNMVSFLEEHTGTKIDLDKLREIRKQARRANEIMNQINGMRKAIPCPMGSGDAFTVLWPLNFMRGTRECEEFYEKLLAELKERVDKGIGVIPDEKFRLMWAGLPFWYNMRFLNYPEDFGGVVVIEGMVLFPTRYPMLPPQDDDPIKDIALTSTRQKQWPSGIGDTIDTVAQVVKDYSIDGVVVTFNPSCRLSYIPQQELMNGLIEHGIPCLGLECDMADERTYSEGQVKTRMDAFIESLLARK